MKSLTRRIKIYYRVWIGTRVFHGKDTRTVHIDLFLGPWYTWFVRTETGDHVLRVYKKFWFLWYFLRYGDEYMLENNSGNHVTIVMPKAPGQRPQIKKTHEDFPPPKPLPVSKGVERGDGYKEIEISVWLCRKLAMATRKAEEIIKDLGL